MVRNPQLSSIQGRLGLLFLAFLCLLIVSVVFTFIGLETQKKDARIINLAGRERMLLQQMTGLVQSYARGEDSPAAALTLLKSADAFEQTLTALRGGGSILDYTGQRFEIAPPEDPLLRAELDALQQGWQEYRSNIDRLVQTGGAGPLQKPAQAIQQQSPDLVEQADRIVRAFEVISTAKITRLRTFQVLFMLVGLLLLSAGWWMTNVSLIRPLAHLEASAGRIGSGDLSSPIALEGPSEIQVLARTMERMQSQIHTSHLDLQNWAELLEHRVQQRTRELEALAGVSREIISHLSIEEVLSSVTEKARSLLNSEVASLCLLDPQGKVLSLHSAAGPETAIHHNQSPADVPPVGMVLSQRSALPCGRSTCHNFCHIIDPNYRASHLAAPLYSHEKVIGALCVGSSKPDAFRPEMALVLRQLSDAAAVAIENSRLYQQSEYAAALEERQRIASEMHDGLLQTLSFLRLMVHMTEEQIAQGNLAKVQATLGQIERAEAQAEREIRQAIASLQDDFPLNDTLQERLRVLANELSVASPPVGFETSLILPLVLSRQESEQVSRVVREAVLNAQRHSQANRVCIQMEKTGSEIAVTVSDQGVGFTPGGEADSTRAHFGLKIMQARATRLGGRLMIQSSPGCGTRIELRWTPAASRPA